MVAHVFESTSRPPADGPSGPKNAEKTKKKAKIVFSGPMIYHEAAIGDPQ